MGSAKAAGPRLTTHQVHLGDDGIGEVRVGQVQASEVPTRQVAACEVRVIAGIGIARGFIARQSDRNCAGTAQAEREAATATKAARCLGERCRASLRRATRKR